MLFFKERINKRECLFCSCVCVCVCVCVFLSVKALLSEIIPLLQKPLVFSDNRIMSNVCKERIMV